MAVWRGPNGITVEVIVLNAAPVYKITQTVNGNRYFLAYSASIEGITQWVDLADLVEVVQLSKRKRHRTPL